MSSRLIAGAILVATGALLTVTGIGLFLGIPLAMLGLGVMFPRFMTAMVALSVLAFFGLIMAL